ncbi:MAG: recombinase RecT, partial [Woeseiaceae bacterium]
VKLVLVARAKTPLIARCSAESLLMATMQAAEVGLEPNTTLQHAAIIPYKNKHTGQYEAQFVPMYRGLLYMARRSCGLRSCRARVVYANDEWHVEEGLRRDLNHKPCMADDRGEAIAVYAIAEMDNGKVDWDWMHAYEVRDIESRSRSNNGPWSSDWGEMAKKTMIKRLMKQLPLSTDFARVIEIDDDSDAVFGEDPSQQEVGSLLTEGRPDDSDIAPVGLSS